MQFLDSAHSSSCLLPDEIEKKKKKREFDVSVLFYFKYLLGMSLFFIM